MYKCSRISPELHWLYNSQFLQPNFGQLSKDSDNLQNLGILGCVLFLFQEKNSMLTFHIYGDYTFF